MNRWLLVALVVLAACSVSALAAPSSPLAAQEVQVALDDAGRVEEIDRSLARRLGLFLDEYPELRVVRLYRVDAAAYVLEVTMERAGRTVRERVPMTEAEVAALRARISNALALHAPRRVVNQDGRFLLLGTTTLVGLGYYGWALPFALDMDDGRAILATYMLTAGASFVVPFLYTRNRPVTYGMANAGFWGTTRGILGGIYLANLLDPNAEDRLAVGLGMATSLGAGLAMYDWARRTDMSAGDAHVIGNHGDFGHLWAGSALFMVQPEDDRVVAAALLAGAGAGVVLGARRAPGLPYTWGDAEVQRGGTYLGAYNALAGWALVVGDEVTEGQERVLGGLLAAGSVAGLVLTERFLEGHDFTAGQGILVNLGAVAGGLLGAGVGVLLGPDDGGDVRVILPLSALGATTGFGLIFMALSDDARRNRERRSGSLDLGLNPAGLLSLSGAPGKGALPTALPVPVLSVRYRF